MNPKLGSWTHRHKITLFDQKTNGTNTNSLISYLICVVSSEIKCNDCLFIQIE